MDISAYFPTDTPPMTPRSALVTGASSGIGLATACALAQKGINLKLVARRLERLQSIQAQLQDRFPELSVEVQQADLSDLSCLDTLADAGFFEVDILINNAGLAKGRAPIAECALEDWQAMIDLNITSAFEITRRCLPHMLKNQHGDLVFLSSIAAHISYEGGSVYCASKHALRSFATILRKETCGQNIRVIQISPGMVETEFSQVRFEGDKAQAAAVYQGMTPLTPVDIASQILHALEQPRHLTLDEMIVMATAQGGVGKVVRKG